MLRKPQLEQTAIEMVTLDGLVPKDHLLRKIEAVIDFSFIHDGVAGLYCPYNGRRRSIRRAPASRVPRQGLTSG